MSAPQGSTALLHRQPTPSSIASVESKGGELSASTIETVKGAMARARDADHAGDRAACEQALEDVRNALP